MSHSSEHEGFDPTPILSAVGSLLALIAVVALVIPDNPPATFGPPTAIPYSLEASQEFDNQLQSLVRGHLLLNAPDAMNVGDVRTVEVRISRNVTEDLRANLKAGGKSEVSDIQVGPFMAVKLKNTDGGLQVIPLTPEDEFVGSQNFTQWSYSIKALKIGESSLLLNVGVRLKGKDGDERRYEPVYEKKIHITVSVGYAVKTFFRKNWQWIASAILIPIFTALIVAWWKRREEERKKSQESKIVRPNDNDLSRLR